MTKKMFCIALAVLMILGTFTACQKNPSEVEYVTSTVWVEDEDDVNTDTNEDANGKEEDKDDDKDDSDKKDESDKKDDKDESKDTDSDKKDDKDESKDTGSDKKDDKDESKDSGSNNKDDKDESKDTGSDKNESDNKDSNDKDESSNTSSGSNSSSKDKSILEGLDFGGKEFTKTIIGTVGNQVMRTISAFEEQYNCKIKLVRLKWETYNSQVATRMASGDPYDICGVTNQMFPECVVQDLYEPLDKYIEEVDQYNPKTGYGIDMDMSSYYNYNGKMYGLVAHTGRLSTLPYVLYYNKLKFKEAGLEDPLTLYNKGKWTWDKFIEYGKIVKVPAKGQYLIGQDIHNTFVYSNDWNPVKFVKGKTLTNIKDSKFINALSKYKEICTTIVGPKSFSDNPAEFVNGNYYMFMQQSMYGYLDLMPKIVTSSAFKKDKNNLGIVPVPVGPNNKTNASPAFCGQGKAAGKGSDDPRVVVAWVLFSNMFTDPEAANDPYTYNAEQQGIINKISNNVIPTMNYYKTSTRNAALLTDEIIEAARKGNDYSKLISDYSKTIQNIIDDSMKQ